MPFTASEVIQTQTSNKKLSTECVQSQQKMLPPALQKNLGLYLLWAALSCSLGMLWGCGSAQSQAQRQPGSGKVIRGDKALCTHSLFAIQAEPRVSSWAAFTGAEPELTDLGWFLLPQPCVPEPGAAATSPAQGRDPAQPCNYTWATNQLCQQGTAAFLPWTPCCKQLTAFSLPAEIAFALNDSLWSRTKSRVIFVYKLRR